MKQGWILSVLAGGLAASGLVFAAEPLSPQQILESADRYRLGWDSVVSVIRITNFKGDKKLEETEYEVYTQRTKSFVKFLSPREKGRSLLMLEDDMWIYIPDTSRPIRITPLQRLTGNVSNGDVARTNYAGDYDATLRGEEDVAGTHCVVLKLTAKRKGATYPMIHYWVATRDFAPCKAEFFLTSGKNHKVAFYEQFADFQGKRLLTRMVIHDKIRPDDISVMEFLNFTPREIPDKYFNKNSMSTN
jgi:outer membrane lipoprotein-sorting protein